MKAMAYVAAAAAFLVMGAATFFSSAPVAAPESTFVLLDGSRQSTADPKGRVTLVNVWATSCVSCCVSCVAEMLKLVSSYQQYQARGYDTVAMAMAYDPPNSVVNCSETRKLPFKAVIDNTVAVARARGDVQFTPTSTW